MNQVAVVIGGGQTLGAFLCRGLAAEGYRVAVVDIQSDKASNVAQEINSEFGEGKAWGFGADATSEQSVLALSRGVDEIFGRWICWSTARGSPKRRLSAIFSSAILIVHYRLILWAISFAHASSPV